jgi:MoxR-like ATPase
VQQVLTTAQLIGLQQQADQVYVDPALFEYVVRLATATRMPKAFGLPEVERYTYARGRPST